MTGREEADFIVFGSIGLMLILMILAVKGLTGKYLHPIPQGVALGRPWAQSACLNLMAFVFLLFPLEFAADDLRFYGAIRPDHWPIFWTLAGIGLAGAVVSLWAGKPDKLVLDQALHTYRHTLGWAPCQQVRTGPWSDLDGIGASDSGLVYVRWRSMSRQHKMLIGIFRSVDRADDYARDLAFKLDVQHIPRRFLRDRPWPNR